jgi:hypothetical protein
MVSGNTISCRRIALEPGFPDFEFSWNPELDLAENVVNESLG